MQILELNLYALSSGIASICLITQHTTIVRQRIEVSIPKKRKGGGTALGAERVREMRKITFNIGVPLMPAHFVHP